MARRTSISGGGSSTKINGRGPFPAQGPKNHPNIVVANTRNVAGGKPSNLSGVAGRRGKLDGR